MILDGRLATTGNEDHFRDSGRPGFLHRILDERLVDDRQHFLGHCLGRRQEPGAKTAHGKHSLSHGSRHIICPSRFNFRNWSLLP